MGDVIMMLQVPSTVDDVIKMFDKSVVKWVM